VVAERSWATGKRGIASGSVGQASSAILRHYKQMQLIALASLSLPPSHPRPPHHRQGNRGGPDSPTAARLPTQH
jgi:hypothetical protein